MSYSYLCEDGWCSDDGCSKWCSMVSCSGAVEGDEGSDVGSVIGVGGMVVDSVGAVFGNMEIPEASARLSLLRTNASEIVYSRVTMVALSSRVPSARVEAVAIYQNCLTMES
ncbi:hypothetical protein Tco_0123238 [Tanacetum coccineum]